MEEMRVFCPEHPAAALQAMWRKMNGAWSFSGQSQQLIFGSDKRDANTRFAALTMNPVITVFGALFACLMIYGSYRHQLIFDEAQAWLIARDSHGLMDLFRHLRYEGHPALWYLLLYLPAHFSGNVVWMKAIHCALSIAMGWLIVGEKRMPATVRIFIIFSAYMFFFIGIFVRSYVLAAVLLIVAARCLAGGRNHWLGVLALGLAINTHFLAIPVAAGIFFWTYVMEPDAKGLRIRALLQSRRFWVSMAMIFLSLVVCYLAVKPQPDVLPKPGLSPFRYVIVGMGREIWRFFVPFSWVLPPMGEKLWVSIALISLGLVGVFALPTRRARFFMMSVTISWAVVEWITAHSPSFLHASFVYVTYVISLLLVDGREWRDFRLTNPLREQLLSILLCFQVLIGVVWFVVDLTHLTSAGRYTAAWITRSGMADRPLVVEPDLLGPAILANSGIASAYYPACRCEGSFVVFRESRDGLQQVSRAEIETLRSRYYRYPLLIVSRLLPDPDRKRLGLKLLYTSPHGWMSPAEDALVYSTGPDSKP